MLEQHMTSPLHGSRLMPQALDDHAILTPDRLYASIPRDRDLSAGFIDISCKDMARCTNFMAAWIVKQIGNSTDFETLSYIGIPDLRIAAVFLGAVKAGYKMLLPSPRNPPLTNLSLMDQTSCSKILYTAEVTPVVHQLLKINNGMRCIEIPSFQEILSSDPQPYPFSKAFGDAKNDPIVVLHSSGSTGIPKPITMTHATFAVLDRERDLPKVTGRKNRDYSIWDFNGGGRFYTVFPYFHLAGFLSILVNPILTESSSPVLGPPLMPPSGSLLKDMMRHQDICALYLPPSVAEQLLLEPNGIEFFKKLDFVCYTGGPFSPAAGEKLSRVTTLCPLYGSTEAFQVPQLAPAPEDWAWMEWNPNFKLEMQPSPDEDGAFELVLFADPSTENMSALNHNLPGVSEYRTKDLFKQHPRKTELWQYYGRRDDIIVLSNGEKFNPVPMELMIQGYPTVTGALIVGQGRSRATLLIETQRDASPESFEGLCEEIWPLIEKANRLLPAQGRILRRSIIVSNPEKPFTRAGKGTIVRKLTEKAYQSEIDALYASQSAVIMPANSLPTLQPTLKPVFEERSVLEFVRGTIAVAFPELGDIGNEDDLFSKGLDSVLIIQLIQDLKIVLRDSSPGQDFSWLDTRAIYHHSSLESLSKLLTHFLNNDKFPMGGGIHHRTTKMEELVRKYTEGLQAPKQPRASFNPSRFVAILGSTGFLGTYIVGSLLSLDSVETVYCLNRGSDAQARTQTALRSIGQFSQLTFQKAKFISMRLDTRNLGLSDADLSNISRVDTIIYNSWKPDFSIPLLSFEKPFLSGLRNIIDICASSDRQPSLLFISSIAAVGHWAQVHGSQTTIPETPIQDVGVALPMGYGESKCVAERILQVAHETCGIPVTILRVGQIGGSTTAAITEWPTVLGVMGRNATDTSAGWPVQEWLLSIIKTSKALGAFPTHVAPVDWIPVDTLGTMVASIAVEEELDLGIFNAVHPEVTSWDTLLNTLVTKFVISGEKISLPAWLDKMREAVASGKFDRDSLPAVKFEPFLRLLGDGLENMRCDSSNTISVTKRGVHSLSPDILAAWLKDWRF
ncbi:acetyl-CoA synthetase-like protein [Melanomma pulvis-pyrius CBS 109.77]|uniref:Acetyl-CoA synthetase-like protein n=1 Tax=Melanomma pulvis-pyrius CBS 109.77 TaxID=1314802 RepID=A0A6A6XSR6_9PLEO|nr:acetyl-CoA synthetase-like protein [Melanomma pulvis-pyrius CBS 109.77]